MGEEGEMDMSIQEKPEEKTSLDKVAELQENVFRKVRSFEMLTGEREAFS